MRGQLSKYQRKKEKKRSTPPPPSLSTAFSSLPFVLGHHKNPATTCSSLSPPTLPSPQTRLCKSLLRPPSPSPTSHRDRVKLRVLQFVVRLCVLHGLVAVLAPSAHRQHGGELHSLHVVVAAEVGTAVAVVAAVGAVVVVVAVVVDFAAAVVVFAAAIGIFVVLVTGRAGSPPPLRLPRARPRFPPDRAA